MPRPHRHRLMPNPLQDGALASQGLAPPEPQEAEQPRSNAKLLATARAYLKQGHPEVARGFCYLIQRETDGTLNPDVAALMDQIETIERSTFATLKNGEEIAGRFLVRLRCDQLGLESREAISLAEIKRIHAHYVVTRSKLSRAAYIETLLNIQFRDGAPCRTSITEEIAVLVEQRDGAFRTIALGYPFELISPSTLNEKFPSVIQDRISRIVVYAALQ